MSLIACLGHLTRDVVAGALPRPGGPVFYSARTLARLGVDAQIGASCARADRMELVAPLEAFGLPVAWYESTTTTSYSFHYEGHRRIMRQEAVGDSWGPVQALDAIGDAEWISVGAVTRSDFPEETLAAIAGGGRKLLVDAQGLVRTPQVGPLRTDGEVGGALQHVTILKLDDEEAEALVGTAEPEALLSLGVPEVILTLGPGGSFVVTLDRIEHVPAQVTLRTDDPTGAGDTFSAAYLSGRARGVQPVEAAARATATVAALFDDA